MIKNILSVRIVYLVNIFWKKFLDYDEKLDNLLLARHTVPCLLSNGFCKPTLKRPKIFVWFPEDFFFTFSHL